MTFQTIMFFTGNLLMLYLPQKMIQIGFTFYARHVFYVMVLCIFFSPLRILIYFFRFSFYSQKQILRTTSKMIYDIFIEINTLVFHCTHTARPGWYIKKVVLFLNLWPTTMALELPTTNGAWQYGWAQYAKILKKGKFRQLILIV